MIGLGLGGKVLGSAVGQRRPPTEQVPATWYLAGGAPAPLAAYQPKGAASLAESYVNLANPGTYDVAPVTNPPLFDTAVGWKFTATGQWLTTGTLLLPYAGTMMVRFSDTVGNGSICGTQDGTIWVFPRWSGSHWLRYTGSRNFSVTGELAAGVMAMSNGICYLNGVQDGAFPGGPVTTVDKPIGIGRGGWGGMAANVQAFAVWNQTLTPEQVAAVSAAMAAL